MADFIAGLELCRRFYAEAVEPILRRHFQELRYSAAVIGPGSEVLGFDSTQSTDHDWGPRVMLFLDDAQGAGLVHDVHDTVGRLLPEFFGGYPTRYGLSTGDPPGHHVEVLTIRGWMQQYLGIEPNARLDAADWLTLPEQKLLGLTSGAVYHDEVGLEAIRQRLAYYPRDVWLYLLASGWQRIGQEEHLMGRAGQCGDEIGSAIIGARLVRDLMRLCFLMERRYAPYAKWFGTAFGRLRCAACLGPPLRGALTATTWRGRERHLVTAYERVAAMHNRLGITEPLPEQAGPFFDRPFRVIHLAGRFAERLAARITDPDVRRIADRRLIGSIDYISDSTDILTETSWRPVVRQFYTVPPSGTER